MMSPKHSVLLLLSFILFSLFHAPVFATKKSYIVYMGSHEHGEGATDADFDRVTQAHHEFLQSYVGSFEKAKETMIYSYTRHINGFAAMLEEEEAADIAEHSEVVSVFLNKIRKLYTTHSWEFMDMTRGGVVPSESVFRKARYGEDSIIAHLDTGVWPESPSFSDEGMGPIPSRWKGICQHDMTGFRCNRKLIGARYFNKGYLADSGSEVKFNNTVRDYEGHGSHTLSTIGGNFVPGASVFGYGNGTAQGGSPKARVASYKVCWEDGQCADADIMAGLDMAIHDGVDVLSLSLGAGATEYFYDGLAIGAFHATMKGISVVCAGGNSGPYPETVSNVAPWILTVGASTLDREFHSIVHLHNGQRFKGASLAKAMPEKKLYPLINAADAKLANEPVENALIKTCVVGVWPESPSFSDEGMGPIPSRWKGICQHDMTGFRCNRKLIGARYFNKGYLADSGSEVKFNNTVRDYEGHGSHTLSTIGGNFVPGASVFGYGNGTAQGGSPKARVASYKVCWEDGQCADADIMAGLDMAIHDGVDVLSLSLGAGATEYFYDGLAIGAFHATMKGISVVCAGGNSGPYPETVSNVAPWILTVGASTLDREFHSIVHLHNGQRFKGASLAKAMPEKKLYPLINAADAKLANEPVENATLCLRGTIDPKKAGGKILVCLRGINARMEKSLVALDAGAVGMILCNDEPSGNDLVADPHLLPASQLTYKDGLAIYAYMNSTETPLGYIEPPETELGIKPAPIMAAFSSRGPNTVTPEILKPDITAPGVSIIAAYSGAVSPTEFDYDNRRVPFITMSGTSMACPHVAGVVGLLKTLYPTWSPAAIKSAIMTTARTRDNTGKAMLDVDGEKANPFAYGSGHIRPNRAMDPGLVYDLSMNDYLNFLCVTGYNQPQIMAFSGAHYRCPEIIEILDFNYPTMTIPKLYGTASLTRRVKNVGSPGTYIARLRVPAGLFISVEPRVLKFDKIGEEKSFKKQ
ncbi:hypothetical protein LR48_Vigan01g320400 [Vigna angularis]|uniref:Uncharacterized protein n=2 Tax=Phaseolus angularis TaxID=3914 RepID=A0A0L9TSS2_PHAAN|nr:hypothetical protein LR48_Vigan01g320400 [Vigna angularis]